MKSLYVRFVRFTSRFGITSGLSLEASQVRQKMTQSHMLSQEDKAILAACEVESQEINVWSFLMPAVYQLVPGSKIANFWYGIIFPPQPYNGVFDSITKQ